VGNLIVGPWLDDVTMPDVEEPMDSIYPSKPSSSRKRSSWLRGYLMMLKDMLHLEEPFVKIRNLIGIRDT